MGNSSVRRRTGKGPDPITRLWTQIRSGSTKLMVCVDHDGQLWATNSYWMVHVPDDKHPMARLLGEFNLPLETMTCDVTSRSLVRVDSKAPDPKAILALPKKTVDLSRYTIGGWSVCVDMNGNQASIWRRGAEGVTTLNRDFVDFIERVTPGDRWMQDADNELKPAFRMEGSRVTAALMPIRTLFSAADLIEDRTA